MARKTKLESLKTYELIVDTAERLFSSKGFSQTTLPNIRLGATDTRALVDYTDGIERLAPLFQRSMEARHGGLFEFATAFLAPMRSSAARAAHRELALAPTFVSGQLFL